MNPFPPDIAFAPDVQTALEASVQLPALRAVVDAHVEAAMADPRIDRIERILIGGSGDSLFAAMSIAPVFRRWTGIPVVARSAIELARYECPLLDPADLVISISNSGSSSRARECVLLAKSRGALTLGVTGSMSGALAQQADLVVHRPIGALDRLPSYYGRCLTNFAEYMAVLYAVYAIALALGVRRQRITPEFRAQQLDAIEHAILAQGAIAARIEPSMRKIAQSLGAIDTIWAIGAGPSRGTAQYCAAKFHEQMPINGIGGDLEEWAHLEYFLTLSWGKRSVVTVIAPAGNSLDRAQELVVGIQGAGGRALVVHQGDPALWSGAWSAIDLGHPIDEWLSPLTFHLPSQLLVLHMAALAGVPHIPLRRQDDTWLICKGTVRDTTAGLD